MRFTRNFARGIVAFGALALMLSQSGNAIAFPSTPFGSIALSPTKTNSLPENDLPVIVPASKPSEAIEEVKPATNEIRLVVKLKARRVYVYRGKKTIASYAIAVGKPGWETPKGTYRVYEQEIDPIFKSFKTGKIIPPGSDNPLGPRWIGIWTDGKTRLGFHGTNQPELIGKAVSHGCIRMRNQDVLSLYEKVKIGTVVTVQP
jgi:L,D-transpeptidase ErfK/SrfK